MARNPKAKPAPIGGNPAASRCGVSCPACGPSMPCAPFCEISDDDVRMQDAARRFVARFGDAAPVEALKRAEELEQSGNDKGRDTWMEIHRKVSDLVRLADPVAP